VSVVEGKGAAKFVETRIGGRRRLNKGSERGLERGSSTGMVEHALREQMLGRGLRSGKRGGGRNRKWKWGTINRVSSHRIAGCGGGKNKIKIEGWKLGNLGKRLSADKEILAIDRQMKILRGHHGVIVLEKLLGTFVAEKTMEGRQGDRDQSKRKKCKGTGSKKNAGKDSRKSWRTKEARIEIPGGKPRTKLLEARRKERVLGARSVRGGEENKTC
jgi:hypothetical protein